MFRAHNATIHIVLPTGAGKAFDQNAIIHTIWLMLAEIGCGAWIGRVPTKANLADDPSR